MANRTTDRYFFIIVSLTEIIATKIKINENIDKLYPIKQRLSIHVNSDNIVVISVICDYFCDKIRIISTQ